MVKLEKVVCILDSNGFPSHSLDVSFLPDADKNYYSLLCCDSRKCQYKQKLDDRNYCSYKKNS